MENVGEKGAKQHGGNSPVTWGALAQVIRDAQREAEEENDATPAAPASGTEPSAPQGDGDTGTPGSAV